MFYSKKKSNRAAFFERHTVLNEHQEKPKFSLLAVEYELIIHPCKCVLLGTCDQLDSDEDDDDASSCKVVHRTGTFILFARMLHVDFFEVNFSNKFYNFSLLKVFRGQLQMV